METAPVQGEHSYGVAPLSRRVQANDVRGSSPIRTTLPDTGLASSNVTEFSHAAKHSGSAPHPKVTSIMAAMPRGSASRTTA
jgi:hypothetical protein